MQEMRFGKQRLRVGITDTGQFKERFTCIYKCTNCFPIMLTMKQLWGRQFDSVRYKTMCLFGLHLPIQCLDLSCHSCNLGHQLLICGPLRLRYTCYLSRD